MYIGGPPSPTTKIEQPMSESSKIAIEFIKSFNWKIFPVNPLNKTPLISDWQRKATNDKKIISKIFNPFSNAMIGLPTGPLNGITVLDVDIKDNVNGIESLNKLKLNIVQFPSATTPSGGVHFYIRTDNEIYPNSVSKIGPGLDIRSKGGYVVAPPSISSIGKYEWTRDISYTKCNQLPMLIKLKELILRKKYKNNKSNTKSEIGKRILEQVTEGSRNDEMTRRCGYLFKRRYLASDIFKMMEEINQKSFFPPLSTKELISIFRSIERRESR